MLVAVDKQVAAVTYRLKGEKIKAALLMNPGKVIITPRQAGKTTSLAEYVVEHHPDGVVLCCLTQDTAGFFRNLLNPPEYFDKCLVTWGNFFPPSVLHDVEYRQFPIYADEICYMPGSVQRMLVRNPRFAGAVSSVSDRTELEVREKCILA